MGKAYNSITPALEEFIQKQHLFFVATAPESTDGLVNLSPKGQDSFRILDGNTVAYLDLTGSGIETVAHVRENRRITIMFCSFEGAPKILRLYGKGTALVRDTPEYDALKALFPSYINARAIIKIDVELIRDACGYAVPNYEYKGDRDVLDKSALKKGEEGLKLYRKEKNRTSLDGLPGLF